MDKNFDFSAMILIFLRTLNVECSEDMLGGCMESGGFDDKFEFIDCIDDLVAKGLVSRTRHDDKTFYEITYDGISVCKEIEELFLSDNFKKRALDDAVSYYEAIKTGINYICDVVYDGDDTYKMSFCVSLSGKKIVETGIYFTNRDAAYKARDYCRTHKESVFNNLSSVLSGELDIFSM